MPPKSFITKQHTPLYVNPAVSDGVGPKASNSRRACLGRGLGAGVASLVCAQFGHGQDTVRTSSPAPQTPTPTPIFGFLRKKMARPISVGCLTPRQSIALLSQDCWRATWDEIFRPH